MATLSSSITIPAGGTGRICFLLTWHFQLMEKYWGKSTFGRRYRWKQYYAKSFCDAAAVADYCFANWARLKEETFLFRDTLFQSEVPNVSSTPFRAILRFSKAAPACGCKTALFTPLRARMRIAAAAREAARMCGIMPMHWRFCFRSWSALCGNWNIAAA